MLQKSLFTRECALERRIQGPYRIYYSDFLEDFRCKKSDEHHIEGQDLATLVPPLACSFSKLHPDLLAMVDEDGGVQILDTQRTGHEAIKQDWQAHHNAIFDVDWSPTCNELLTASGDKTVALWDVSSEAEVAVFRGHKSSIKTVHFLTTHDAIFASGSRDGSIMLWDKRVGLKDGCIPAVNVIHNAHACNTSQSAVRRTRSSSTSAQDRQLSVTSVVFQDDTTLMSAGSADGSVKVWDLRKNYTLLRSTSPQPKHVFPYAGTCVRSHGFSNLVFDSYRTRLFASCIDNYIYQFDCTRFTTSPVAVYGGHMNATFYVKAVLSPDDRYLLSGSTDSNAYVWRVNEPDETPYVLTGHSSEVTAVDWCQSDIGRLVTLSDDNAAWIWRLDRTKQEMEYVMGRTHRQQPKSQGEFRCGLLHSRFQATPLSPRKGAVLPPATIHSGLSSSIWRTLSSLPSSVSTHDQLSSSLSQVQLQSPSITRWFRKSTPHKLKVTPKKSSSPGGFSLSADVTKSAHMAGVKRKLCSDADDNKDHNSLGVRTICPSKITRIDLENNPSLSPVRSAVRSGETSSSVVLSAVSLNFDDATEDRCLKSKSVDKCEASGSPVVPSGSKLSTPGRLLTPDARSTTSFRSPTVNLPNYVFDPQPRTPIGRMSPRKPRQPDWLTQHRIDRQTQDATNPAVVESRGKLGRGGRRTPAPAVSSPGSSPLAGCRRVKTPGKSPAAASVKKCMKSSTKTTNAQ